VTANERRTEWAFGGFLFLLALAYAAYTGHVWEDYFITFRHSKNFAEGRGLLYHEGERLHGFTSPLGVLLPALFHVIAGNPTGYEPALWMFRIVGALAYAGTGVLLLRLLRTAAPGEPLIHWAGAILFAADFKSAAFSVNGQETGLMLFFLAWALRSLQLGADVHWKALGLAWAGLQWTRPDGCIFAAATALSALLWHRETSVWRLLVAFLKAGALSLVLYAPWLIATTVYYGTPIPHTVTAKAGAIPRPRNLFGGYPNGLLDRLRDRAGAVFEPIYAVFGGWPETLVRFARGVGLLGMIWWMLPIRGPLARFSRWTGFAGFLTVVYLAFVLIFPWYLPPVALLMVLSLAVGAFAAPRTFFVLAASSWLFVEMWDKNYFARLAEWRLPFKPREAWAFVATVAAAFILPRFVGRPRTSLLSIIGVSGMLAAVSAYSWREIAVQQEYVENQHRRVIGEWLRENVKPRETIYVESLGYIGYFSNGTMLDWPGLVAPAVVDARRKGWQGMITAIGVLTPDWLVLREDEFRQAAGTLYIANNYDVVREFDAAPGIRRQFEGLAGLQYLLHDAHHFVLRKRGLR